MNFATQRFLETLNDDLLPVRGVIERFASSEVSLDPASGALRLSHRPKIGTEAYACLLHPGVGFDLIDRYERIQRARFSDYLEIPPLYRNLLTRLNGAYLFDLSLFGIPLSMTQDPPLLNRSALQPLDVGTANENWRLEYGIARPDFHFAAGPHSNTENVGYFLTPDNSVEAYLTHGKRIGRWKTVDAFLAAEIDRAESRFPDFEWMMESAQSASKSKPKAR